jgi:hypothetical protein
MPNNPMECIWPGIVAAQAIHAAARLAIPDLLAAGPRSAAELAASADAHAPSLDRLLRVLSALEVFTVTPDGRFGNTAFSETLRADHPQSQRAMALFLPAAFLWRPIGELCESVRTGEPAFERVFGQRFFEYLASHPDDNAVFNSAMTHGVPFTSSALLSAYDFSRFRLLADVGGGEGALLRDILAATPGLRGLLFDLPQVVARADDVLSGEVAARCRIVGGSFFDAVPVGADACIMKGVIHDWPDEDAATILRNTRRALPQDGTLLLIENVVDAGRAANPMELLMLVVGGRERTEAEFRSLLSSSGFTLARLVPMAKSAIVECRPA